tara:strand:+ start:890 stop:1591 length:702 start_codon:yes stop_codon:yes gene_type:complete
MIEQNVIDSDYRYERKFHITNVFKENVKRLVLQHPAIFLEQFYRRNVNNIYFDTFKFKHYFDSVDGSTERIKVRIRWYGKLFGYIEKPVLEFKIKKGLLGKKLLTAIKPFTLYNNCSFQNVFNNLTYSEFYDLVDIKSLIPTLINQYSRNYYLSSCGNFRITIDSSMKYFLVSDIVTAPFLKITDNNSIILELKYDANNDYSSDRISNFFPFRMTKISKYVTGLNKLYDDLLP